MKAFDDFFKIKDGEVLHFEDVETFTVKDEVEAWSPANPEVYYWLTTFPSRDEILKGLQNNKEEKENDKD